MQSQSFSRLHTEVYFASFLSGGFTAMVVMNPTEKKAEKRISVDWLDASVEL